MAQNPNDTSLTSPESLSRTLSALDQLRDPVRKSGGAAGAEGPEGPAGAPGAKWWTGAGEPAGGTGVEGDFYLRSTTGDVYQKTGVSTWELKANIKGPTGEKGATGSAGTNGTNGLPGESPGVLYEFLTNTEATAPGKKKMKFNNATVSSATKLYVSRFNISEVALKGYIAAWDDSTNSAHRGYLIIKKLGAPANLAIFEITGASVEKEAGEWFEVTITNVISQGTFAASDQLSIEFARNGDTGPTGSTGSTGGEGPASWTPVTDASIKALGQGGYEKATNVEGDATLRSQEGFVRGCFVTFKVATTTKGLGIGLNTDPATDEGFPGIDYFLNCTASGTILIRESGTEVASPGAYAAGDTFSIVYDGGVVRYYRTTSAGVTTLLREVQRPIGSALYMDSWWNQEGGKIENLHFGPMGERGPLPPEAFRFKYSTNTESTDPGAGFFKFNKTVFSEISTGRFSETDADGNNVGKWIQTWDDNGAEGTNERGKLYIQKIGSPNVWVIMKVFAAITDEGTWDNLQTNMIAQEGALANGDECEVSFVPAGIRGEKGEKGETGAEGKSAIPKGFTRDVWQVTANIVGSTAAGSYLLGTNGITAKEVNSAIFGMSRHINPALYAVEGKTTRFRLVLSLESNLTAPSAEEKFKLGLYKVSITTGAGGGITRLGELVKETGARKLEASKFAQTVEVKEFEIAAAGDYFFMLTIPAIAAASYVVAQAMLYVENL